MPTTTRVKQLTRMNVQALEQFPDLTLELGATYAEFNGDPHRAGQAIEAAMLARGGVDATYRSLMAVRRKLRNAVTAYTDEHHKTGTFLLTKHVTVSHSPL